MKNRFRAAPLLAPLAGLLTLTPAFGACPQGADPPRVGDIDLYLVASSPRNKDRLVFAYASLLGNFPGKPRLGRSLDGGVTTEIIAVVGDSLGSGQITDVEFSGGGVLYVTTDEALFQSADLGSTFTRLWSTPDPTDRIWGVSIDPFDDDHFWVCGEFENSLGGSLARSADGGTTWNDVAPLGVGGNATSVRVLFDADADGRIIVHEGETLFRSEDGGQTFPVTGGFAPVPNLGNFVPVDTVDGLLLYQGTLFFYLRFQQIRSSIDNGLTRQPIANVQTAFAGVVQNPLFPERLAFATEFGFVVSGDGGATWTERAAGELFARGRHLVFNADFRNAGDPSSDVLITGGVAGLVSWSVDGMTKVAMPIPSDGVLPDVARASGLRIDPEDKDRWVYGAGNTALLSEDRGLNWVAVPALREWGYGANAEFAADGAYLVSPRSPEFASTIGGHLIVQADGSVEARGSIPGAAGVSVQSNINGIMVVPSPVDTDLLIASSRSQGSSGQRVFLSDDGGASWNLIDESTPSGGFPGAPFSLGFRSLGIRPAPTGIDLVRSEFIYGLVKDEEIIEWSPDQGSTWRSLPMTPGAISSITFSPTFPEVVYATSSRSSEPMIVSQDRGFSWAPVGPAAGHGYLARGHTDPGLVIRQAILGGDGIVTNLTVEALELSRDGGLTWTTISGPDGPFGAPTIAPDDSYVVSDGLIIELGADVGTSECSANVNSTGQAARIRAVGSDSVADGNVTLIATNLPASTFGIFATSMDAGFTPNLAGGAGNLCLGGSLARINPSALQASSTGVMPFRINTNGLPQGSGLVPVLPGQTWRFQAWFRDGATSNLSDAIAVLFRQ